MLDTQLFNNLLKAVDLLTTILFVGDIDQLPSIGPGTVLRDIINSGCFEVVRLTEIFRQARESLIVMNAHSVNQGIFPNIKNNLNDNFFFIQKEDPEEVASVVVFLASDESGYVTGITVDIAGGRYLR